MEFLCFGDKEVVSSLAESQKVTETTQKQEKKKLNLIVGYVPRYLSTLLIPIYMLQHEHSLRGYIPDTEPDLSPPGSCRV